METSKISESVHYFSCDSGFTDICICQNTWNLTLNIMWFIWCQLYCNKAIINGKFKKSPKKTTAKLVTIQNSASNPGGGIGNWNIRSVTLFKLLGCHYASACLFLVSKVIFIYEIINSICDRKICFCCQNTAVTRSELPHEWPPETTTPWNYPPHALRCFSKALLHKERCLWPIQLENTESTALAILFNGLKSLGKSSAFWKRKNKILDLPPSNTLYLFF